MTDEIMRICDTCDAFGTQLDHDADVESAYDGACRRFPPTIVLLSEDGEFAAMFPPMNREDWCGSWKPRRDDE